MAHKYTWDKLVKNAYRLNPKSREAHLIPLNLKYQTLFFIKIKDIEYVG